MKKYLATFFVAIFATLVLIPAVCVNAANLPAKYRNKNLPEVRSQGAFGLCYLHSMYSAIEAELIQNNKLSKKIDLSEAQCWYFNHNPSSDKLGFYQDSEKYNTLSRIDGGFEECCISSMISGMVLTNEKNFKYADLEPTTVIKNAKSFTGEYYVKGIKRYEFSKRADIKNAIKKYGAVTMEYFHLDSYFDTYHNSYYCPYEGCSHAVAVVGWDDNYSVNNFSVRPPKKGAWICRNSWGEDWGDKGYFYISYYDKSIGETAISYDVEPGMVADNTYQYDFEYNEMYGNNTQEFYQTANVYTAKANAKGYEELRAVAIGTSSTTTNYKIEIYKDVQSKEDPTSGTLVTSQSGKIDKSIYVVIPLKEKVAIAEKTRFSIVVTLKEGKKSGQIVYEGGGYAEKGQSFYRTSKNGTWDSRLNGNFVIKAFTVNKKIAEAKKVSIREKNVILDGIGDTALLHMSTSPSVTKTRVGAWKSSNTKVVTISKDGLVTAVGIGTATISLKSSNNLKATCKVTVANVFNVHQSYKGNSMTLSWNKIEGASSYRIKYKRKVNKGEICTAEEEEVLSGEKVLTGTKCTFSKFSSNKQVIYSIEAFNENGELITQVEGSAYTAPNFRVDYSLSQSGEDIYTYCVEIEGEKKAFLLYQYNFSQKKWVYVETLNESCFLSGLKPNTKYTFGIKIRVYHGDTFVDSTAIEKITFKTPIEVPKLKAQRTSEGVKLSWNKISGATGYYLYRRVENQDNYKLIKKISSGKTTSFIDKNFSKTKENSYCIVAVKGSEKSPENFAYYKAGNLSDEKMKITASLKKEKVTIKWNKVYGATGYIVYRKTEDGEFTKWEYSKGTSFSEFILKNTRYKYFVNAYYEDTNEGGGKSYSLTSNVVNIRYK